MKQKQANTESGRSMVEILAVLVLIGLLTIAAIIGIFLAVYKNKANIILHDSKIAFMGMKTASTRISLEWNDIQFQPVSGKKMTVRRDFLRRDFVKVDDVEQGVCRQMLNMRTENVLNFYNLDNTEMTTCDKTNDIIVDWNGFEPPAVCQTVSDCNTSEGGAFDGICDEQGQCRTCPENQKPNDEGTECICNPEQAITCVLDQESWCCGPELVCGETVGECVPSDYMCAYDFYANGTPDTIYYTDCSYSVADKTNMGQYMSDCSYYVSSQDNVEEYRGDCNYVVQQMGGSETWTDKTIYLPADGGQFVTQGKGCDPNQYCSLFWTDSDNDGIWKAGETKTAAANTTGVIWGKCQMLSTYDQTPITNYKSGYGLVTQRQGCPEKEYCSLFWIDENDDGVWDVEDIKTAPANTTGIIWGKCQMLSSYDQTPITDYKNGYGLVTVNQGCPIDNYCAVLWTLSEWTPETKTPTAPANATGMLYGRCQMLSAYEQVPLSKNESGNTRYRVVKECPVNTYCYLNWKTDTDCSTVPANATGTIYGACTQLNSRGSCPYEE